MPIRTRPLNKNLDVAEAFSAGCEARMQGIPISDNPNPGGTNEHAYWRKGWREIDLNFGRDAPLHWQVRLLPAIIGKVGEVGGGSGDATLPGR